MELRDLQKKQTVSIEVGGKKTTTKKQNTYKKSDRFECMFRQFENASKAALGHVPALPTGWYTC